MNRNGFGATGAKSLSSTSNGKRDVVDVGPDRIIQYVGGGDIVAWFDSTDPRLSSYASGAALPTWYDKSVNKAHMANAVEATTPTYSHNATNLNGRPCINAVPASSQCYTGSLHVSWSSNCYTLMLGKHISGDGYFYGQTDNAFEFGHALDKPNVFFGLYASEDAIDPDRSYIQLSCIGKATNTNLQWRRNCYYEHPHPNYGPPYIANLKSDRNGDKFGLIHATFQMQLTSAAGTVYDDPTNIYGCPGPEPGCLLSSSLPTNAASSMMSASTPGGSQYGYGPGNLKPHNVLGNASPEAVDIEALILTGYGESADPADVPLPVMFSYSAGGASFLGADMAFFLGLKRTPKEAEMLRLEKAVRHKFGNSDIL